MSTDTSTILIAGSFLIVLAAVIGLVVIAVHTPSSLQVIVPVLAAVVSAFATGATAVITHMVGANFELKRNAAH